MYHRRCSILLVLLLAACSSAQWLDLTPVVLTEDLPPRHVLHANRFQINDLGQALYMVTRYGGVNPNLEPEIRKIYIDDLLIHESAGVYPRNELGDINDDGVFTFS